MYEPRTYRHWVKDKELVSFNVVVKETDLHIRASRNLSRQAIKAINKYRNLLEKHIERHPSFLTTLEPVPISDDVPPIIKAMSESAEQLGVGPMASVAGAMAESVGNDLLPFTTEMIVENGGDIYLKCSSKKIIGIYAGQSPLTGQIGLEIEGADTPLGICTSSGTVGHSLSFGKADAVVVLSHSTTLADAAATAVGNLINQPDDIPAGIEFAKGIEGLTGLLIIIGDKMGIWGEVIICSTSINDD